MDTSFGLMYDAEKHIDLRTKEQAMAATIDAGRKPARFVELDALRGLAALLVVLHHLRLLWETDAEPTSRGLHLLLSSLNPAGNASVILFFVLSGFVLSLPAISGRPQSYLTFAIRRVFRIYVPYLAALAAAVAGAYWLHGIITRSVWFHTLWSEPVDWRLVLQHVLFIGAYNTAQFDNPIWSLVHEMRISLIFPPLCAVVLRLKSKWSFVVAIAMSALAGLIQKPPFMVDWPTAASVHYAGFFVFGITLARERNNLGAWFLRWPGRFIAVLIGLTLPFLALYWLDSYGSSNSIETALPYASIYIRDWVIALCAGGLMIISISSAACKRVLSWAPIHFLGEVSYSLYLWHVIVLLYCVHLLYDKIPLPAILLLVLVLSLAVSWCSYHWIEKPSMELGRKLSSLRRRSPAEVTAAG
jgi:peptidoglycan/LPS O-acetylase OafA/YrhL